MKSSVTRLHQLLKLTSPLALITLAVSLSQSASAQLLQVSTATFSDIGTSNQPPVPGPNDIYQTNISTPVTTANGNFSPEDNDFAQTSTLSGMAGEYFVTGGNPAGYTVTNFAFELSPLGYTSGSTAPPGAYTVSGPNTWVQPWLLNFYQISGTTDPSGLGSNALLIASVLTTPGSFTNLGDWLNIGNLNIPLAPNTTNAWTVGIFSNGAGYCPLLMEVNNNGVGEPYTGLGGGAVQVAPAGPILVLSPGIAASQGNPETAPGGASNVVNYGVGVLTAVGNQPVQNCDMVFDIGITPGFVPPTITTNPIGDELLVASFNGQHGWNMYAAGTGPTNAPYGLNGYWQKGVTNVANGPTNWTLLANGGDVTITTTVTNYAYNAASVGSSVVFASMTLGDVAAYRFIVTNSFNGLTINSATSAVVSITAASPAAGSYAATAISLGADAYWPLDEKVDPSTEKAYAYDIIGGFNGWYGNNANNAGGNAGNHDAPVAGPSAPSFAGFPTNNGAYGGMRNSRPYTYVIVSNMPTLSAPNVTWTGWIYPLNNPPANGNGVGIFMKRAGTYGASGGTDGIEFSSTTQLGYHWAPDAATSWNALGPVIPSQVWSMIAVVITPTYAQLIVCNTNNGFQLATTNNTINTETMGPGAVFTLGADEGNSNPGRTFVGYLSAFAMFPSSLTVGQIAQLYDAGLAAGNQAPIIANQPLTSYKFINSPSGKNVTFPFSAFGAATTNGAYWQKSTSPGSWVTLTSGNNGADISSGAFVTNVILTNVVANLLITNVSLADAGSYRCIVTNSAGNSATSVVATISFVAQPAANSYAGIALSAGYNAVAYWPLNDTTDPSVGGAEAYELLGGFNGFYGTNANNAAGNAADHFSPVAGPAASGLAGFAAGGALGSLQGTSNATYVTVPVTPTLTAGTTNATLAAWVYPNLFTENPATGIAFMRGSLTDGINYAGSGAANSLGYTWDNNNSATYNWNSGLYIPSNMWSLVALVITPNTNFFYVGNTNEGLVTSFQVMTNGTGASTNIYQAFAGSMNIGNDSGGIPARSFGGSISSLIMFNGSLTYAQIANLFDAGIAQNNHLPFVTQNPLSSMFLPGLTVNATFTAAGYGGTLTNGSFWQRNTTGSWVTLVDTANGGSAPNISGSQVTNNNRVTFSSTLTVSNVSGADVGSYQLVFTNSLGNAVTSAVATLSFVAAPVQANSFEQYALTNGVVAFWPLNETVDPSTGVAEAFDIVGGFNGLYGVNANDGGGNAANSFAAATGPAADGLTGFAPGGALGSQQSGLANTYVTTLASPSFPPAAANAGTNMTIIAWIKPNTNENALTGLLMQRTASQVDGLTYGSAPNTLGYNWDNNPVATALAGPEIKTNTWSMVAMVISSNNTLLYVCNSNAVFLVNQSLELVNGLVNTNQTWGGPLTIGADPTGGGTARYFGGSMSSVAIFSNALSTLQIEGLYIAGQDSGAAPGPVITANPPAPLIQIIPGLNVTLTAAGFATLPAGGYWQKSTTPGVWGAPNGVNVSGVSTFLSGTIQQGALAINNVSSADVGSYQLVVTNGAGSATSTVVVLTVRPSAPPAGGFAADLISPGFGAVAFWPLTELVDPSSGSAVAYDVVGGFNGSYGINADNGGGNAVDVPTYYAGPVPGPGISGLTGLPNAGALGSLRNSLPNTYVSTVATPTFAGLNSGAGALPNSTNMTLVGWFNPQTNQPGGTALMFMRSGQLLATRTDGLIYGPNGTQEIGYAWDNNSSATYGYNSGLLLPTNAWSMVALVITPSNSTLYVGTNYFGTNVILRSVTQNMLQGGTNAAVSTNMNEPWGAGMTIGGDPGNNPTNVSFAGSISSVAMFSNSLTVAQVESLFIAGESNGLVPAPFILTNPVTTNLELIAASGSSRGGSINIVASGYGTQPCQGFWQVNTGGGWNPAVNGSGITGVTANLVGTYEVGTLQVTNFTLANVGSYRFIITNNGTGLSATSSVVTISAYQPPAGGFAAVANSAGYGAMALWPLNETGDPASGTVVAYDVIGGFNGLYRTNAQDGTPTSSGAIAGTGAFPSGNQLSGFGPGIAGLSGFGAGDTALGTIQNRITSSYVTTTATPTLPAGTTNATMVAWIYPMTNELASCGIFVMRVPPSAGTGLADGIQYGNVANTLGYHWDNDIAATYNYSGPAIRTNVWSMVAVVITPTTNFFYVCSTNGITTTAQAMGTTNTYRALGASANIGNDPYSDPGRTFGGYISSVAVFSNSLSTTQIENLFAAGEAAGSLPPIIVAQPSSVELITGASATLRSTGYCGTNGGGYWQVNFGSSWVNLTNGYNSALGVGVASGATNVTTNGLNLVGALVLTNIQAADVASYRIAFTNSAGTTYSAAAALSLADSLIVPGSFASLAITPSYGAVAYWPLNETGDPSTGSVVAYEYIGGYNGTYGVNAQDGGANSVLATTQPANYFSPVQGPGAAGLAGLPSSGALGSIHNVVNNTFVTTTSGPVFPVNQTNQSSVAWIYPIAAQTSHQGIWTIRNPPQTNALSTGVISGQLGYNWDNNNNATTGYAPGLFLPSNAWCMVGLVITPTNSTLYLGGTNGLQSATQVISNINEPGGFPVYIGTDPNSLPNDSFGGAISSLVMFSNALTVTQMANLLDYGLALNGAILPFVVSNPPFTNYQLVTNGSATITAIGYGGPAAGGYWQVNTNGSWVTLTNGSNNGHQTNVNATLVGANVVGALVLTNVDGNDAGSYQLVITNAAGMAVGSGAVVSSTVSVSLLPNPLPNTFEAVAMSPGYGLLAFWPLSDVVDTTTNPPTYDVWGGWNGIYGVNAGSGFPPSGYTVGVLGPGTSSSMGIGTSNYLGFAWDQLDPSGSGFYFDAALGTSNAAANSTVKTVASPTFATNNTNMSIVAWIYPMAPTEASGVGLVFMRSGGQVDGLTYGAASSLADTWNGVAGPASFLTPPVTNWSMVAFVNTATNSTLYLCTTNEGIQSVPQVVSNAYQAWGNALDFGGDPGTDPGLTFNGDISSVAIFSNALSQSQIGYLFAAGVGLGVLPPIIATQPNPTVVYQGRNATFNVIASGVGAIHYQWYQNGAPMLNQTNATLVLSNYNGSASYYVKVTDNYGTPQATSVNSTTNTATTVAASTVPYVTNVLALNPVAYYRLNEAVGATNAFDYWGGYVGVYGSAVTAGIVQGPTQLAFPLSAGFDANNLSADFTNAFAQGVYQGTATEYNSQITIPALNINSNAMTITMWINPNEAEAYTNGLLYCRGAGTIAGFGFGTNAGGQLGYNWNNVAGTYNWISGLVPAAGAWNFVALVITPTNGTIYCYNGVSQLSAVNQVTNATQLWASPATIGDDLLLATGARQFDGAIDEVAIFNKSLTGDQINKMFTVGTGIPIPAAIQAPITGQTNFVNSGTVTYTVAAVNGPLFYQWIVNGVVVTNGNNGYSEVFSGATNATLTISNYSGDLAALPLSVSVTNLSSSVPATSATTLPSLFPTPAIWTTSFVDTNGVATGNGLTDTGYTGYGAIGQGTFWNPINIPSSVTGVFTNVSSLNDLGTSNTGVSVSVSGTGYSSAGGPFRSLLFDLYLNLPTSPVNNGIVITAQPGFYNLFIYSLVGTYGNRGTTFTVHGNNQNSIQVPSAVQGGATYDITGSFLLTSNYVIFTNVLITNGTLNVGTAPDTTQPTFNGLQLQLISPFQDLAVQQTGTNAVLSWAGGTLVSGPTVTGPWTPVVGPVSTNATYIVPGAAPGTALFYRMQLGTVPGIPPQ